ncbi:HlyD family efflux transporter periplasmic adaptor subunit [bacterium]|nr:HlyD family efflux transporter periplasmic adaptor subunit [bacterium]
MRKESLVRGGAILLVAVLVGCGEGPEVEALHPRRGIIEEAFEEPGRTRLENSYPVSMPVNGRIARIELEAGDRVEAGQSLVEIDRVPFEQDLAEARAAVAELEAQVEVEKDVRLESTAKIGAEATISAALEALNAMDSQIDAEQARADRTQKELRRIEELARERTVPESELDDARLAAETAVIELRKQEFYRSALKFTIVAIRLGPKSIEQWLARKDLTVAVTAQQLLQARARLVRAEHQNQLARVISPIDGTVLERYERGDSVLSAGQALLLLGNLNQMEVIVDTLTRYALRLQPGTAVELESAPLRIEGRVKRVEPAGFTKLSSLGVEQQRVNVIVSMGERPANLGVGYRLRAHFITSRKEDALIVPRYSVLQAPDQTYYVFKIGEGKLVRQPVRLGLQGDLALEIAEGLEAEDEIVARPDATMAEGESVSVARSDER